MGSWVYVDNDPPFVIYNQESDLASIGDYRVFPFLLEIPDIRYEVKVGSESQENSALNVTVKNPRGEFTNLVADPPIGIKADIYKDGEIIFTGIVESISLGATSTMNIEA